jgi:hypothetical protein
MGANVDPSARRQSRRPHLVEEDEGTDRGPLAVRQRPVDLEPAEIVGGGMEGEEEGVGHAWPLAVIASEAKQSSAASMQCWIATSLPRSGSLS